MSYFTTLRESACIQYAFCTGASDTQLAAAKQLACRDLVAGLTFIRSLRTPYDYWLNFCHRCNTYTDWRSSHPFATPEHFIAENWLRGKLRVYKINTHPTAATGLTTNNMRYTFISPSALLLYPADKIYRFANMDDVQQQLQSLVLSPHQLQTLVETYKLPIVPGTGGLAALCNALLSGTMLLIATKILKKKRVVRHSPEEMPSPTPPVVPPTAHTPPPTTEPILPPAEPEAADVEQQTRNLRHAAIAHYCPE